MTYGTSRQTYDAQICKTQSTLRMVYTGRGSIGNSTSLYLKRDGGERGFYVPDQTVIGIHGFGVITNVTDAYSTSTIEHVEFAYLVYRDGGNVTVILDPATPQTEAIATFTVVANTTVQGFELKVDVVGTPGTKSIAACATLTCNIIHEPSIARMQAGSNSALTVAE